MRAIVILGLSGLLLAAPAHAQVARPVEGVVIEWCDGAPDVQGNCATPSAVGAYRDLDDNRITVLASGQWTRIERSGQAITVLDAAGLAGVQGPDITRALQRLPGIALTRNGGLGSFTGISVRGSASERVLVLVDGVRLNDVAGPAGGFDFGSVVTGGIARVELLRGPGSVVWGSDALGGVIHLATRVADGVAASAEYGGDGQLSGQVGLGGQFDDGEAGLAASYVTRHGFSAAEGGTEADGFEQLALSARGELAWAGPFSLFANARYAASSGEIDGLPAPAYVLVDTAERQDMRQFSARAGAEYADGDGSVITASIGHAATRRDLIDEAISAEPFYVTRGRSTRAELRGRLGLTDDVVLVGGADWEWSRFADGYNAAATDIGSAHAMVAFQPEQQPRTGVNAGLRIDRHREFGSALTFAANGFVALTTQTRLRAAYGEGFKAPSLFQLYSDYGNLALQPERSRSYEAAIEVWPTRRGARLASVTLFRSDSRGLIDFIACPPVASGICAGRPDGTYDNVGRARSQGIEAEAHLTVATGLEAGLAYAVTTSTNRETGRRLARRPRDAGTLSLDWQALAPLSFGADLRVVSAVFDDPANTVRLGGHALLDLRTSWALSERFDLYGRIENAWDERYQTAAGYAMQGRAAFLGVRARL